MADEFEYLLISCFRIVVVHEVIWRTQKFDPAPGTR